MNTLLPVFIFGALMLLGMGTALLMSFFVVFILSIIWGLLDMVVVKYKLWRLSDEKAKKELKEMIKNKRPGTAFLASIGESQRYWALKKKLGEL